MPLCSRSNSPCAPHTGSDENQPKALSHGGMRLIFRILAAVKLGTVGTLEPPLFWANCPHGNHCSTMNLTSWEHWEQREQ